MPQAVATVVVLLFLPATAAPSQKFRFRPAVLTRLTCLATAVWTENDGDGIVPMARPLLVSAPS